jgi:hypothetical protein
MKGTENHFYSFDEENNITRGDGKINNSFIKGLYLLKVSVVGRPSIIYNKYHEELLQLVCTAAGQVHVTGFCLKHLLGHVGWTAGKNISFHQGW